MNNVLRSAYKIPKPDWVREERVTDMVEGDEDTERL